MRRDYPEPDLDTVGDQEYWDDLDDMSMQIHTLEDERNAARAESSVLREENTVLKADVVALKDEVATLKARIVQLHEILDRPN